MTFTFAARGKIKRTKKTKGRDYGCRARRCACYSSDSNYALLCLFSEVNFKEGEGKSTVIFFLWSFLLKFWLHLQLLSSDCDNIYFFKTIKTELLLFRVHYVWECEEEGKWSLPSAWVSARVNGNQAVHPSVSLKCAETLANSTDTFCLQKRVFVYSPPLTFV